MTAAVQPITIDECHVPSEDELCAGAQLLYVAPRNSIDASVDLQFIGAWITVEAVLEVKITGKTEVYVFYHFNYHDNQLREGKPLAYFLNQDNGTYVRESRPRILVHDPKGAER